MAAGYDVVVTFVNDDSSREVLEVLKSGGVKLIALRCAGFDRVDLAAAEELGIKVVRVPAYSPRSVAEHAFALLFSVARNLKAAQLRVAAGTYTLSGLVGTEVSRKTYGVVGTGKIGLEFMQLLQGLQGTILAYDVYQNDAAKALGATYVSLEELLRRSDFISLHAPLLPSTKHTINAETLKLVKPTAILINCSRGGLVDTKALLAALYEDRLGGFAADVYEGEDQLFFKDFQELSAAHRMKHWNTEFIELKSLPQTLITPHIAFLTHEALSNISTTTRDNIDEFAQGKPLTNEVKST